MSLDVLYQPDSDQLLKSAQRALADAFQHPGPILFLSSGGSCLALLDNPQLPVPSNLTLGVVDERWTTDPADSNTLQFTRAAWAERAAESNAGVIATLPSEGEGLNDVADRVEQQLRTWRQRNPNGRVVITLGIGADGHTAGILPDPEDPATFQRRFDNRQWVVGYDANDRYPGRVTVTFSFLRTQVHQAIVFAAGETKTRALQNTLATTGTLAETPARILHELPEVVLFTDQMVDASGERWNASQ